MQNKNLLSFSPFQLHPCNWTHCVDPPYINHTSFDLMGETQVAFWDAVPYKCDENYFFEDNRDRPNIMVVCQDNGKFNTTGHPDCVVSKWV